MDKERFYRIEYEEITFNERHMDDTYSRINEHFEFRSYENAMKKFNEFMEFASRLFEQHLKGEKQLKRCIVYLNDEIKVEYLVPLANGEAINNLLTVKLSSCEREAVYFMD